MRMMTASAASVPMIPPAMEPLRLVVVATAGRDDALGEMEDDGVVLVGFRLPLLTCEVFVFTLGVWKSRQRFIFAGE
jgi:hypothetical protein